MAVAGGILKLWADHRAMRSDLDCAFTKIRELERKANSGPPIPMVPKHLNSGACAHCDLIFRRYPGFNQQLWDWFKAFQAKHPEAHISCAGRGYLDQEAAVVRRTSRAHYGESFHNYNAAIDLFELRLDLNNIYDRYWYTTVLRPELPSWVTWYGEPNAVYYELPHVEITGWKALVKVGQLKLVKVPANFQAKESAKTTDNA